MQTFIARETLGENPLFIVSKRKFKGHPYWNHIFFFSKFILLSSRLFHVAAGHAKVLTLGRSSTLHFARGSLNNLFQKYEKEIHTFALCDLLKI
jgi:hypothetical protein